MRPFLRDQKGSILILYALCLVPILLAVGSALDYAMAVRAKRSLQATMDAALLAAAAELPDADKAVAMANAYFDENATVPSAYKSFQVVDSVITGNAGIRIDMYVMQLAGIDSLDVGVTASAASQTSGLELIMVLDVRSAATPGG